MILLYTRPTAKLKSPWYSALPKGATAAAGFKLKCKNLQYESLRSSLAFRHKLLSLWASLRTLVILLVQWNLVITRSLGPWKLPCYIRFLIIRVKNIRNIKSWDQQNYLVIRGFCYIRPLYNGVPLYYHFKLLCIIIYYSNPECCCIYVDNAIAGLATAWYLDFQTDQNLQPRLQSRSTSLMNVF